MPNPSTSMTFTESKRNTISRQLLGTLVITLKKIKKTSANLIYSNLNSILSSIKSLKNSLNTLKSYLKQKFIKLKRIRGTNPSSFIKFPREKKISENFIQIRFNVKENVQARGLTAWDQKLLQLLVISHQNQKMEIMNQNMTN